MPAPTYAYSGGRVICKFGGKPWPGTATNMTQLDLNDGSAWTLLGLPVIEGAKSLNLAAIRYRHRSKVLGRDTGPKSLEIEVAYSESGGGTSVQAAKAKLTQAGLQYLTFDNATQIEAELAGDPVPILERGFPAWTWLMLLEFLCPEPFARDISATTPTPTALSGSTGGSTTSFNVAYPGGVFCEPTFTLDIPITNAVAIASLVLKNTLADPDQVLTLLFNPALAASTHWVLTINSETAKVTDAAGKEYEWSGTFPLLLPAGGANNTFQAILTTASGTSSGVTLAPSYYSRWEVA